VTGEQLLALVLEEVHVTGADSSSQAGVPACRRTGRDGPPDHLRPCARRSRCSCSACSVTSATRSDRPYRRACSQADALAELRRCAGEQFRPGRRRGLLR
jgi:hypothetical protein